MIGKSNSRLSLGFAPALLIASAACGLPGPGTPAGSGFTPVAPAVGKTPAATGAPTSAPPTAVPTAIPTVIHKVSPGEPPGGSESQIRDADTSSVASQRRANGGKIITTTNSSARLTRA
jgi:hypothetical protein